MRIDNFALITINAVLLCASGVLGLRSVVFDEQMLGVLFSANTGSILQFRTWIDTVSFVLFFTSGILFLARIKLCIMIGTTALISLFLNRLYPFITGDFYAVFELLNVPFLLCWTCNPPIYNGLFK